MLRLPRISTLLPRVPRISNIAPMASYSTDTSKYKLNHTMYSRPSPLSRRPR